MVETTKNGMPMATVRMASTLRIGLRSSVGASCSTMAIGLWRVENIAASANTVSGSRRTPRWIIHCFRGFGMLTSLCAYR